MSIVRFPYKESPGIARDIEPYRLPIGVWSDGENMLFQEKQAQKAFGYSTFVANLAIKGRSIFFCPLQEIAFWVYPGLTAVGAIDADGGAGDITRGAGAYTGGEYNLWTFAYLHGIGFFNNGVEIPQAWDPPALGTNLVDDVAWTADIAAYTTKCLRAYRNFLVALDVYDGATRHGQMVKWSHPALPGAAPASWDAADATKDAGEVMLSETPGVCIDCLPLGGTNIIYKEDSVYSMAFVGGQLIFGFQMLFKHFGILGLNCVGAFAGHHFVATRDDVVVHNGIQARSVVSAKNRNWIFDNMEQAGKQNCYVIPWDSRGEMWFCFPTSGTTIPDTALVYNTEQDSSTFRELGSMQRAVFTPAIKSSQDDSWDGGTANNWNTESSLLWNELSLTDFKDRVLFISRNADDSIFAVEEFDETAFDDDGTNRRSYLERRSMAFVGMDERGNAVVDLESVKFIKEIFPRITGTATLAISVYIGTQMFADEAITWEAVKTFNIATSKSVPVYKACRFLSIRFENTNNLEWAFHGFSYELEILGRF